MANLSLDEQAAAMAELLIAKSEGAGALPEDRKTANGALSAEAGGEVLDKSKDEDEAEKACAPEMKKGELDGPATKKGKEPLVGSSRPGPSKDAKATVQSDADSNATAAAMAKAEDLDEDDEKESKEEEEAEKQRGGGDAKKSEVEAIDADQLMKSLATLEAIASGSAQEVDRQAELLAKIGDGSITKSEREELIDLIKAEDEGSEEDEEEDEKEDEDKEDESEKSFQSSFAGDDELRKGYEVSTFLERHSQLTAAALDEIRSTLSKSIDSHVDRSVQFNVQLAKSLSGLAQISSRQEQLIKSLTERLEQVEKAPLPRKGVTNVATLQKSLSGEVGATQSAQLNKSQVLDALERMAVSGMEITPSGYRLDLAIATVEQGSEIAKSLYGDVVNFVKNGAVRAN